MSDELVAALSNEQIANQMRTTPSKTEFENFENNTDVMMTIVRHEIKGLIAQEVERVRAKRTQAEV